jgi:hypothetical protein
MEKVCGATSHVGPDVLVRARPSLPDHCGALLRRADEGIRPYAGGGDYLAGGDYAVFFSTSAEFFDPNPTQLQIACST